MPITDDVKQKLLDRASAIRGQVQPAAAAASLGGEITPTVVQPKNLPYSLTNIPQFEQDALPLDQMKVEQGDWHMMTGHGAEHPKATAYVSPKNPLAIEVLDPNTFRQAQLDHETTHAATDRAGIKFAPINPEKLYDYGGVDGLSAFAQSGKPVNDYYSTEQAARIVEDHAQRTNDFFDKVKSGQATQEDLDDYKKWQGAAAPIIHGLAKLVDPQRQYVANPVPANSLADIPEMSQRYVTLPANLPHRQAPQAPQPGQVALAGFGSPTAIVTPGSGQPITQQTAERYMDTASNSPTLARAMAVHDNHTF